MRNANWTRILTILLAILALYAILAVAAGIVQRFVVPLLLLIFASIVAFVLTPVVDFIQNRFHVFRGLAILVTYLLIAAILGGLGYFMTAPLVAQTKALSDAIRFPTHIQNVVDVRDHTRSLLREVKAYQHHASSFANGYCESAAYLQELKAARLSPSCTNHPLKPRHPTIPQRLHALRSEFLPELAQTSIRPTSNAAAKHHQSSAPIPTTQVPPRFTKPLFTDIQLLHQKVSVARHHFRVANLSPSADAAKVLAAAKQLRHDADVMYRVVKTTPVILLALQNRIDQYHLPIDLHSLFGKAVGRISSQGSTLLNNAVAILTGTINVIADLVIIIIMSIYLTADGGRFIGWVIGVVPEDRREQAWFFIKSLDRVLGGYVRGQLIVAVTVGVLAGVGSYVLGVPYALLIGIFAFLAESIPVIGPILASIPAVLVSLFTQPFLKTLLVVGWFIVIQQIEQNVVGPRITGHAVGIHPVVAMVAIIVGIEVGGFWGAFLAVPITGLLQIVVRESYRVLVLQRPMATAPIPDTVELPEEEHRNRGSPPAAG